MSEVAIDFGTSNTVVARLQRDAAAGRDDQRPRF